MKGIPPTYLAMKIMRL